MTHDQFDDINISDCLTTGQAARDLGISPGTLSNWRSAGIGPKYIKHRRNVYYLKSEIIAYKRKNFRVFESTQEWRETRE